MELVGDAAVLHAPELLLLHSILNNNMVNGWIQAWHGKIQKMSVQQPPSQQAIKILGCYISVDK